jgi:superfamily II DNA or RNA helicase
MKISHADTIYCKIEPAAETARIKNCFEYDSVHWRQAAFHKEEVQKSAYYCNHPHRGWFHAGLLPRVVEYCNTNNINAEIEEYPFFISSPKKINLPGITFWPEQLELINTINKYRRGIIKAPTGSGKTVIAAGVISQYPKSHVVFCVHLEGIFTQTIKDFKKWFGEEEVGIIGNIIYDPKRITVLMVQTAGSISRNKDHPCHQEFKDFLLKQDILIIDEAHHVGKKDGHYGYIFENCLATIRIGFSATVKPVKREKEGLIREGYLGPIIGELTDETAIKRGIIVKTRLRIIPVPKVAKIAALNKKYHELYLNGLILNRVFNRLVVKEAYNQIIAGKSVLIMITDVEHNHGETLQEYMRDIYGIHIAVVHGGIKGDLRQEIKDALNNKDVMGVVVTSAWREGVNIPSLDCVINAVCIKSETATIQMKGRGTRVFEGKDELLLIDFMHPYKFLAEHSIERLKVYHEMGILNP